MDASAVLVLNQNYEPLNVCNVRRALVLLLRGKAEIVESSDEEFHSTRLSMRLPSVIRMIYYVRRPRPRVRLSRREIFERDGWSCMYCGATPRDLTLDHVIPRHRGGTHSWDNLVSACKPCNHRKAGRTPTEALMPLRREPGEPRASIHYGFFQYLRTRIDWRKFVPGYEASAAN